MENGHRLRADYMQFSKKLRSAAVGIGEQRCSRGSKVGKQEAESMNIISYNVRGLGRGDGAEHSRSQ